MLIFSISNEEVSISINGGVSGGCFDGMIYYTTLEDIKGNINSDCPESGKLKISGNGEAIAEFLGISDLTGECQVKIGDDIYSTDELPDKCVAE